MRKIRKFYDHTRFRSDFLSLFDILLLQFLRQSNQLVERNLINTEGRKLLAKMLTKTVTEVKGIYSLDEKRAGLAKSGKLLEKLKSAHQTTVGVMEDRFVLADLARQVQEKKLDVQRNYYESDLLRKSVQSTNAELRREREVNEKRLANTNKATGELVAKSVSILKLLENSADVCKLRLMEEEKKVIVEEVDKLREKRRNSRMIYVVKEPLKTVIECAKHYMLCQSLTPKLMKSKKNLEVLKDEEESRRACGSLDETMQFDRSFVLASMDKDPLPEKLLKSPPVREETSQKSSSRSTLLNESIAEQSVMEVEENSLNESTTDRNSAKADVPSKLLLTSVSAPDPPSLVQPPKYTESIMETQRVLPRELTPEQEHQSEELEDQADRSIDVMDIDQEQREEDHDDLMDHEEQEAEEYPMEVETQKTYETVSPESKNSPDKRDTSIHAPLLDATSDHGDDMHNDTANKISEDKGVNENASIRSNNFSFNFFGNAISENAEEDNATASDANFDFNFGGGDDGSSNGSGGGFDFLSCGGDEDGQTSSTNAASDPFGFGSNGAGTGGGDLSFSFNFDNDNDGGCNNGAGGNSTSFFDFK
uniref:Lebercilin domain-containing protein n=1 Tax=Caenorhabditis tropicalis TaxID=1561998 RepID=A0A1I7TKS8_9PELO